MTLRVEGNFFSDFFSEETKKFFDENLNNLDSRKTFFNFFGPLCLKKKSRLSVQIK